MNETDDIPTFKHELERKLVDAMAEQVELVKQGRQDPTLAAWLGGQLWSATAGIVDQEVSDLLRQVYESAPANPVRKRHFANARGTCSLYWIDTKPDYVVVLRSGAETVSRSPVKVEADERPALMEKLVIRLAAHGYVEI